MLPPDFHWQTDTYGNRWLLAGALIIGSYSRRVTEGWVVWAYRYRFKCPGAYAPSEAAAVRWLERWATANQAQLRVATKEPWPTAKPTRSEKVAARKSRG